MYKRWVTISIISGEEKMGDGLMAQEPTEDSGGLLSQN
jgi:hypothetical protein